MYEMYNMYSEMKESENKMLEKKIYGFVTIGTKGQIVIPAEAREALNLQSGDHLFVVGSEKKGVIALVPESNALEFMNRINKTVEDFQAVRERGPDKFED